jgi:hypothetical protein
LSISLWIFASFIFEYAYGGTLRALFTQPSTTKGIKTYAEVLASGLPWDMVLYGEELEDALAISEEPVPRAIWDGKIVAEFEQVITGRVGT